MKKFTFLNLLILTVLSFSVYSQGGNCLNLNFGSGTFANWQCHSGSLTGGVILNESLPIPGRHTIMDRQNLILNNQMQDEYCPLISKVPNGFNYSARIGNDSAGAEIDAIEYTINVDSTNSLLIIHFAWVMGYDSNYSPAEQPMFSMVIRDTNGIPISGLPCGYVDFIAGQDQPNLACESANLIARNWTTVGYSLEPLIGKTVKIYFETRDCTLGNHFAYAYVAAECRTMSIDLQYCNGMTASNMRAPSGFTHYKWTRSSQLGWIRQTQGASLNQNINVPDPHDGEIFTCELTSELGPQCTSTVKVKIVRTIIDAVFQYGVKDASGNVHFNNWENCYDTCSRTATFVDFSTVQNSKKQSIRWRAAGLNDFLSEDSMYTYTFPDPDVPTTYLIRLEVTTENGCYDSSMAKQEHYITIYPSSRIEIVGDTQMCVGDVVGLKATAKRSSFVSYQWSDSLGNNLGITDSISITTPGTYYVEAVDINGCIARATHIITHLTPIMTSTVTNASCYGYATGIITHGPVGGGQIPYDPMMWFYRNSDGTLDTLDKYGNQGGKTYSNLIAGTYVFFALDANLCLLVGTVEVLQPDSLELNHAASIIIPSNIGIDNGKVTLQAKGGTPPYDFRILEENGITVVSNTNYVENLAQGTYIVEITDANGCITMDSVVVGLNTTPIISGTVTVEDNSAITSGKVYLYMTTSADKGYLIVDSSDIQASGMYHFVQKTKGEHLLKVVADNIQRGLRTYYGDVDNWIDATSIMVDLTNSLINVDIEILVSEALTGNAQINGYVYEDGNSIKPYAGGAVLLQRKDIVGGQEIFTTVAGTRSNNTGFYEFRTVPIGDYIIIVDITGLHMINIHIGEIAEGGETINNLNYVVTSKGINTESAYNSIRPISSNPTLILYPNPVQHTLYIESSEMVELISIYDITGKMLQQTNYPSPSVEMGGLANGIYLVKVKTAAGESVKKVIKN